MCRVLVPGAFLKVECGSFEKCNVALLAGDVLVGCAGELLYQIALVPVV